MIKLILEIDPYYEHLAVECALSLENQKFILYPNSEETAYYRLKVESVALEVDNKNIYPENGD